MNYFIIEPEVPGGLGPRSVLDRSVHPPTVKFLHFVFDGWLGDQLVESFPCWLISASLAQILAENQITGWSVVDADIEVSSQFYETSTWEKLPEFKQLIVTGVPNADDFCISSDHRLQVSEKALSILLLTKPVMMDVSSSE